MNPDAMATALRWLDEGRRVAAATLVETLGSAPLDPGAEMLVDDTGRIEGSVTGGCVEGALVHEAGEVLGGHPARVVTYGISDQAAADVGLMCGGTVRLFVHEIDAAARDALAAVAHARRAGTPVALATLLDGEHAGAKLAVLEDGVVGALRVSDLLDDSRRRGARGFLDEGPSAVPRYT